MSAALQSTLRFDHRQIPFHLPNGCLRPFVRDNLALRVSAGISIYWKSPLGPLRIDLAVPLVKQSYDKTQVFNFSTSTRF